MSCDWDVRCIDCGSDAGFDDANHALDEMRAFAKAGPELARLAKAWLDLEEAMKKTAAWSGFDGFITLRDTSYGRRLAPKWWAEHGSHRLVAVNEYGQCDDECGAWFKCGTCEHSMTCRLPTNHQGDHSEKRASPDAYVQVTVGVPPPPTAPPPTDPQRHSFPED